MWKIAHVRDEKKNITTKEKISLLKTSEYSDFESFWHKKRFIISTDNWKKKIAIGIHYRFKDYVLVVVVR